ncbi:hypothetical protein CLQ_13283 (plasmid) [Clostridium botulinum Af84]|uniref:hypothetical protein n=1 Tax=Clostridium botulinum TaxID=1491 RepID=UPI00035BACD1|nr:hypothetical protein [Clostridium botulinum]APR02872.1 hypothetical protein RSJ2_3815 [Clostridium botulinum]AUN19790.1 hypothetical protein B2M06_19750 [Clostridium botulinum]EPS54262.1 hypothetical protein CLQ_13283 [Clostridium botulinum Af84]NFM83843.1 hypothetical protein [Clostridium botulinum]NFP09897.1 hypothetical protein [Clostridium botulinum]
MDSKIFTDINGLELLVKNRKSNVILEIGRNQKKEDYNFVFNFTSEGFRELLKYIESVAYKTWNNLNPKEATSLGSDYAEYYDSKLDNNGYLVVKGNFLLIERPSLDSKKLYQFNKKKMESFIYDLKSKFN